MISQQLEDQNIATNHTLLQFKIIVVAQYHHTKSLVYFSESELITFTEAFVGIEDCGCS